MKEQQRKKYEGKQVVGLRHYGTFGTFGTVAEVVAAEPAKPELASTVRLSGHRSRRHGTSMIRMID